MELRHGDMTIIGMLVQLKALIHSSDVDGDGKISLADFRKMLSFKYDDYVCLWHRELRLLLTERCDRLKLAAHFRLPECSICKQQPVSLVPLRAAQSDKLVHFSG